MPSLTSTPEPTAQPTTAAEEPRFFASLTNAGFEEAAADGVPYAWRKVGGRVSVVGEPHVEGAHALRLDSETTSTKWAYQTVSVQPGAYYEASVYALKNDPAAEAVFLRLSWYAAEDGDGAAIDSADSVGLLSTNSPSFLQLTTGPVQAPSEARSVRVKLMLRPISANPGIAYFDDVRLNRVSAPASPAGVATVAGESSGGSEADSGTGTATPAVLGVVSTPVVPANVRSQPTPAPLPIPGPGSDRDWLTYASMSVALVALGLAGFSEYRRRAERRAP
jgi:hypothetical protein